jgi:hypothetical protein
MRCTISQLYFEKERISLDFIIRIYHDARSYECQKRNLMYSLYVFIHRSRYADCAMILNAEESLFDSQ